MDLIIIFLAKNVKLFLDHTDPLKGKILRSSERGVNSILTTILRF